MNKSKLIIALGIVAIGGMLIYYRNHSSSIAPATSVIDQKVGSNQNLATKTDDHASVNVMVTPLDVAQTSKEWKFDIGMNTHSVTLDQDMTSVVVLVDDKGIEHKPLRWEGAPAGGHHREGVLVFNAIAPVPKSVQLKIVGIGGVLRSFVWQL